MSSRSARHPMLSIREVSPEEYEVSELELLDLSRQRLWLFDLEATGLDTRKERVTQIAGIPLESGRVIEEEAFTQFVHPGEGIEIPLEVQELTGITPETLIGAPPFADSWAAHLQAARGSSLWVGQSVFEFDVPLLETELERHGMKVELPPILDTVALATWLLGKPENRWSTSALLQHYQVDISDLRRHDALDDVKILGRILLPMLDTIRNERGDRVSIPAHAPIAVRRHPPITD